MPTTTFLRLLAAVDKAAALRAATAAYRFGVPVPDTYNVDPASFRQVPGSPFAYWVSESVRRMFEVAPALECEVRSVCSTNPLNDDTRYFRLASEVPTQFIGRATGWVSLAKGGAFSPYYEDVHLVAAWDEDEHTYRGFLGTANRPLKRPASLDQFFRPGLTYPRRTTSGLSVRVMPAGCIFADKGPAIFVLGDEPQRLMALLAIVNSAPFAALLALQLGAATAAARSYEVGLIQKMPVPDLSKADAATLAAPAREAHNLKREADRDDEATHPFTAPALVRLRAAGTLAQAGAALAAERAALDERLAAIQRELDDRCFTLYGFSAEDRTQAERGAGTDEQTTDEGEDTEETSKARGAADNGDEDDSERGANTHEAGGVQQMLRTEVASLLMYAVGCAFGRWDVRISRDHTLTPKLADPFAPLPVCAPGALVGLDGLPATRERIASEAWLRARPDAISLPDTAHLDQPTIPADAYPLPIAWDGILVDDPAAPNDIVQRIRLVLDELWGERASAVETEACGILGVRDLREYLHNPRAFFDFHIGRYSKSRRKAPIYWLLQSPKRHYAIWLYYHRLDADLVFKALNFHLLPKIRLEEQRLAELKMAKQQAGTTGAEARRAGQAVDRQEALLADLREFRDTLDRAARLYLTPDLNDGVLLNIAPFCEVVPWKEAKSAWQQLLSGKYEWSSIGKQLELKGR